ncbi:ABC transporter ATP-binding protein [Cnuibacter sp. UC19_7]|uniref:ABC transporter ATP-binding protein n=1 Tax=Cnuibacter sp. UC19_7 TaxID=3350166 RepID=UPI0036718D98
MATSVPVIQVQNVSKRFTIRKDKSLKERLVNAGRSRRFKEDFWALKDVSFEINAGTTVGLIGSNGSGKSTMLKAIGGIIEPTRGAVRRRGRLAALLELGAGFHQDLTGRENVYLNASILGLSRRQTDQYFDEIVEFSGIGKFIDTQVKFYSSGMYIRLAFSVAVHVDPDLLLVDEVLAVGDEAFQRKCLDKIREFQYEGRTIVIVSHSLEQVSDLCERVVLLNRGELVVDGSPIEATAAFRDILERDRVEGIEDSRGSAPAPAAPAGEITGARVHAIGRAIGEPVQPGDDLEVQIDYRHAAGIDDWIAGLGIDNTTGQVVYATTTQHLGVELDPLKGDRTVEFLIKDVRLGGGKYFINGTFTDGRGVHLADGSQIASFDVTQFPFAVGSMYAEPSVREIDPSTDKPSAREGATR